MYRGSRLLVPACLLLAVPALAQAPAGYKLYQNKLSRVKFYYPPGYEELPLPPTEQVLVAKFLMPEKPAELKRLDDRIYKAIEQQIHVFAFDLATATTNKGGDEPKPDKARPTTVREAMEAGGKVGSWKEFAARFDGNWNLREDPKKPGWFALEFCGPWQLRDARPAGFLVRKQTGNTVFGVYGFTLTPADKALTTHVQKLGNSLELQDADAGDDAEAAIDRLYASGKYRAVDLRKQARSKLAQGWRAVDTENFLVVHHSKNTKLIAQIQKEVEAMRALYAELFPAVKKVDSVSIIRVCRTMDEYHQYGGPPSTGGYWHSGNEELVFYDYSYTMKTLDSDERRALGKNVLSDDDSLLVLYHEAFHQYIHYAIGEFSPHDWFNEGYGDYFSGAVIGDTTGKVLRIDPSPWRIHLAKDQCEFGEGFVPLKKLLYAERPEFYDPKQARNYYAAAWSFVFFLKHAKEAAANPKWAGMLATYFDTVKASYQEELQKLGEQPDLQQKQVAGFKARKTAIERTLEGIELPALEAAWRKWVVELKDPWPQLRKKHK